MNKENNEEKVVDEGSDEYKRRLPFLRKSKSGSGPRHPDPYFRMKVIIVVMIAVVLALAIFNLYQHRQNVALENASIKHMEKMREQQIKLDKHVTEVIAYKDKLDIKSLRIRNVDNVLKISGYIQNTGKREVNDVIMTVYFMDENDLLIDTRYHTASSSDGSPLKRYQRRKFSLSIEDASDTAKEIQVIVSDIEFSL